MKLQACIIIYPILCVCVIFFSMGFVHMFVCMYICVFRKRNRYDWTRFRALSRLDKKFDDALTRYYKTFYAMCKRACGLKLTEEEGEQN